MFIYPEAIVLGLNGFCSGHFQNTTILRHFSAMLYQINLPASSEFGNKQNSTLNNATGIIVQCLIQP